ncbi:MAG: hypothetical protein A2Z21_00665 [Candidatus Fraserbacteria bacterium RBG_16_55_9]|uniref:HTH arsR-type domain-containing protein n=1 Tax=Fraserbacteria sp. (strain RBG_16_55_9) TaxID=1817864 RepID=A0A1F5UXG9_FRAXR|nr:MAG: hypothetical protein A2Z21_00665 [Candidatus Fraserbacteria bacterium RBG_16_55_9]
MQLLSEAGLVEYRKEGRWRFYRLAGSAAPPVVREALRWVKRALASDEQIAIDAQRLKEVLSKDKAELAACYRN